MGKLLKTILIEAGRTDTLDAMTTLDDSITSRDITRSKIFASIIALRNNGPINMLSDRDVVQYFEGLANPYPESNESNVADSTGPAGLRTSSEHVELHQDADGLVLEILEQMTPTLEGLYVLTNDGFRTIAEKYRHTVHVDTGSNLAKIAAKAFNAIFLLKEPLSQIAIMQDGYAKARCLRRYMKQDPMIVDPMTMGLYVEKQLQRAMAFALYETQHWEPDQQQLFQDASLVLLQDIFGEDAVSRRLIANDVAIYEDKRTKGVVQLYETRDRTLSESATELYIDDPTTKRASNLLQIAVEYSFEQDLHYYIRTWVDEGSLDEILTLFNNPNISPTTAEFIQQTIKDKISTMISDPHNAEHQFLVAALNLPPELIPDNVSDAYPAVQEFLKAYDLVNGTTVRS